MTRERTQTPPGHPTAFCRVTGPAARAVYIIPSVGGTERKLAETRQPGVFWLRPLLAWSPDSKSLVISDVDDPEKISAPSGFTPGSLFLLSIDTGQKRRLTFHSERPFVDAGPAFSPDGRSLAFVRTSAPPLSDLYVVPMSADFVPVADPRRLTSWNRFTTSPAWLRNGKELIVGAGNWENVGLWRVDASGKGSARRLEFTGDYATHPALSQ